jgi:hypothetical protein
MRCLSPRIQASRLIRTTAGEHANQVDVFTSKFRELRDQFIANKTVDIQLSVIRVADDIARIWGDVTDQRMYRFRNITT